MESLIITSRLLLGGILLMSGLTKLQDPQSFVENVLQYRILPKRAARAFGRSLPHVEIAVAFQGLWRLYR